MASFGSELSEAQCSILGWVKDGCPDGIYEGYTHRISAAALRSRGLIRISGRGPSWRAEITEAGLAYLKGERLTKRRDAASSADDRPGNVATADAASGQADAHSKPSQNKGQRALRPTEQLIADLMEAGGVMRVPYWRSQGERDYRLLVDAARRWNKVPEGKRLVTDHLRGELEIRLVDAPEGAVIAARPVPVPARLTKPHPVARQYREDTAHHKVSRAALARVVRIIHALAVECERRGYELRKLNREPSDSSGGRADLAVEIRGHSYAIDISEEKVPRRGPWEEQERYRKSDFYTRQLGIEPRIGRYDKEGTGRLTLTLGGGYNRHGRQSSWGDRRSWKLEDKLPNALQEAEVRAVEDDHAEAERRRQEEERQRQWEAAMERAQLLFLEAEREKVLRSQIGAWQEVRLFERYLSELEEAHGGDPEAGEWIEWVRSFITRLNPLSHPQRMPEVAEPEADELKPFLGGWSPYGPKGW